MNDLITDDNDDLDRGAFVIPQFTVPTVGVGTMRATGSWLVVMLAAATPFERPQIILEAMKHLGITTADLIEVENDVACPHCGISKLLHRENNGKCF